MSEDHEERIKRLEDAMERLMNPWPTSPLRFDPILRCPKCHIDLSGAMGYVCTVQGCPTGMAGPSC